MSREDDEARLEALDLEAGFRCPWADAGRSRCPSWRCDCFVAQFPDDPFGLHPGVFVVGTAKVDEDD